MQKGKRRTPVSVGDNPGSAMVTITCVKCGKIGRIPEEYLNHSVKCKVCGSIFRAESQAASTHDEPSTAFPPPPERSDLATFPPAQPEVHADVGSNASADRCPYCLKIIDPPPKQSRRCPLCRGRMVMRRHKLLTEQQAVAFDVSVAQERAARQASLEAERERYACLPESPISVAQYREIIHRNAYIWSLSRFRKRQVHSPSGT